MYNTIPRTANVKGGDIMEMENKMEDERMPEIASEIVKFLARTKELKTMGQIKESLDIPNWNTIQRNLNKLEQIGRVHIKIMGTTKYYELNGKGKHQDSIKINNNDYIWIDIFEPETKISGNHFVRIKQSTKIGPTNKDWETKGSIIITKESIGEFIKKLENIKETLEQTY